MDPSKRISPALRLALTLLVAVALIGMEQAHQGGGLENLGSNRKLVQWREGTNDWKDTWMRTWIARQEPWDMYNGTAECLTETCIIPKYVPARASLPPESSRIPKVLFQTWKTNRVGPKTHKVVMRWLTENPEYEYVFMTDEDVAEFMCTTANHATLTAYDALKAGACRADVWRVQVIYWYGGIYVDSDSGCVSPFRDYITGDLDMVSALDNNYWGYQNYLAYSPRHVLAERALSAVVDAALAQHATEKYNNCAFITGPTSYWRSISGALKENNCSFERHPSDHMIHATPLQTCPNEKHPNRIGRIKIYANHKDFDKYVKFKEQSVSHERSQGGEVRYDTYGFFKNEKWEGKYREMFRSDIGLMCGAYQKLSNARMTAKRFLRQSLPTGKTQKTSRG